MKKECPYCEQQFDTKKELSKHKKSCKKKPVKNQKRTRDEKGRWVKGVSGNPDGGDGRPKGSLSVVGAIKRKLKETPPGQKKTYLRILVERILKKAMEEGDVSMIKEIVRQIDGMPKQHHEVSGGDVPLTVQTVSFKGEVKEEEKENDDNNPTA